MFIRPHTLTSARSGARCVRCWTSARSLSSHSEPRRAAFGTLPAQFTSLFNPQSNSPVRRPRSSQIHSSTAVRSSSFASPASVLQSLEKGGSGSGSGSGSRSGSGSKPESNSDLPTSHSPLQTAVADALRACQSLSHPHSDAGITQQQFLDALTAVEVAAQQISGRESVIISDPTKSRSSEADDETEKIAATSFSRRLAAMKAQNSARLSRLPADLAPQISQLSEAAYQLVRNSIHILDQDGLRKYTNIQCLLQRPRSLPEIFDLFSNMPSASKVQRFMNPVAVDASTAFSALKSAILLKDAPLALAIIDTSVAHPSFRRVKFIKEALPPLGLLVVTPAILFPAAHRIASAQASMPTETASTVLFVGVMTYLGVVSSMAYVTVTSTITTANRDVAGANGRVTWVPGTPLWRRWMSEHERLAIDQVVSAWGFADDRHWGGEEGQEWQELKECAALRGLQIDANV